MNRITLKPIETGKWDTWPTFSDLKGAMALRESKVGKYNLSQSHARIGEMFSGPTQVFYQSLSD